MATKEEAAQLAAAPGFEPTASQRAAYWAGMDSIRRGQTTLPPEHASSAGWWELGRADEAAREFPRFGRNPDSNVVPAVLAGVTLLGLFAAWAYKRPSPRARIV